MTDFDIKPEDVQDLLLEYIPNAYPVAKAIAERVNMMNIVTVSKLETIHGGDSLPSDIRIARLCQVER